MPQVPYKPVPTVGAAPLDTPQLSVNTPAAAFGADVAQAMGGLAKQFESSGDEIFKRALALQAVENDAVAKEGSTKYLIESAKLQENFNSLQGKNAPGAMEGHMSALDKLRKDIRGSLPNDAARKIYDGNTLGMMGYDVRSTIRHAATQHRQWASGASKSNIEAIKNTVAQNAGDDDIYKEGVKKVHEEVGVVQSATEGWSPEQTKINVDKHVSDMTAQRIMSLASTEPVRALQLYNAAKADKTLDASDIDRVGKVVNTQMHTTQARVIANSVFADRGRDKSVTLDERLKAAEERAKAEAPNDPVMHDYVRQATIGLYNQYQTAKRERDYHNRETVEGAMMGGGPGGKVPVTYEELVVGNPQVEKAFLALDLAKQRQYMTVLAKNAKGDVAWTTEGLKEYQGLKGLAAEDPVTFMDKDVVSLNIPWSARKELVNLQGRMKAKAEGDPRVFRAMGQLGPVLQAAGISRTQRPEDYYAFVGGLQEALEIFQTSNKRPPKPEEIQTIGQQLLSEQRDPNRFSLFGLLDPKTPLALQKPTEKEIERIRADPEWKRLGIEPTEERVRQIWLRERYKQLFSGYSGAKKPKPGGSKQQSGPAVPSGLEE